MALKRLLCFALLLAGCLAARAQPDYGPAHWVPPSGCTKWYTSGNGHHFCAIHDMEGYYQSSVSYLNRCDISASVHYLVNGLQNGSDSQGHIENNPGDAAPGDITQSVREAYYAWHVGCWNTWMFGTEHEGFASNPAWYSEAMYQASSLLQRHLCDVYAIPKDRNHIIGHNEWQNASWKSWMAANYPSVDTTCNTHTDPGPYWDWTHFMALIAGQVNNSGVVSGNVPGTVVAGQSFTATVTMTNSGSKGWTNGATNPHRLGSQSPQDNTTWGTGRVNLPSSPINPGQTAAFTINATAPTTPGTYAFAWKMVQEGVEWFGQTFSANVTVLTAGPTINTPPQSKTVNPGSNVTFTVSATGTGTLTYRWRKNGVNLNNGGKIAGATTAVLTVSNVQQTEVGNYSVAVTDANGTVTSTDAALTVNAVIAFNEDFEAGLGNWGVFASPGTALTISTAQHQSGVNAAHVATSTDRMYRDLGLEVDGHLRITFWIYDSTQARAFIDVRGYSGGGYNQGALVQLFGAGKYNTVTLPGEVYDSSRYQGRVLTGANAGWFNLNAAGAPTRSTGWHQFVIERLADGATVNFYIDGILGRQMTGATASGLDSAAIGSVGSGTAAAGEAWIDDVKVEYFDLPTITTQPTNRTVVAGAIASFSVGAAGTIGNYQWRKNGINLSNGGAVSGATSATLTLSAVQGTDAATYDVVVSNGAGPVNSASAVLRVAPAITSQAANSTNNPGTTATFTITAAGQAPLSYQWRRHGTNLLDGGRISGAATASLVLSTVSKADEDTYSVVVTNIAGAATGSLATLVVLDPPTIIVPPADRWVAAGSNVTFAVTAAGTPPLYYQWRLNDLSIPGATASSYTRLNAQSADAGDYSVQVSNSVDTVISLAAVLAVNNRPVLSSIADRTVHAGAVVNVRLSASDPDPGQTLAFTLEPGAPATASMNPTNGLFTWPTTSANANSTNSVTARVTDSGNPALSDTKSFIVSVISSPTILSAEVVSGDFILHWSAIDGHTYRVQSKSTMDATDWSDLTPDVTVSGSIGNKSDPVGPGPRFYRVVEVD